MSNRIRTFHGNAVPSETNLWDLSTLEHDSTTLLRNVGVRQPSDVAFKRIESSATPLLKLVSGQKTPPVPILRHMSPIHVLINYFFDNYQNAPVHIIGDGFGICMPFPRKYVRSYRVITQMADLCSKQCHLEVKVVTEFTVSGQHRG
jgi:hypothetical protein